MTQLKSQAHPDWPYSGTAHEWRGFVKTPSGFEVHSVKLTRAEAKQMCRDAFSELDMVYQKQNFGPELK